jgi:hypothetical protein
MSAELSGLRMDLRAYLQGAKVLVILILYHIFLGLTMKVIGNQVINLPNYFFVNFVDDIY